MAVAPTRAKLTNKNRGIATEVARGLSSLPSGAGRDRGEALAASAIAPAIKFKTAARRTVARKPRVGKSRKPAARAPATAPVVLTQYSLLSRAPRSAEVWERPRVRIG